MSIDLDTLTKQIESLEDGSREADRDIALYLGLYDNPEDLGSFADKAEAVVGGGGQTFAPLAYTSSIDHAMTLIPERWHDFCLDRDNGVLWRCDLGKKSDHGLYNDALEVAAAWSGTPAAAISACALRAMKNEWALREEGA